MISWVKGSRFKVSAEVAKGVMDQLANEGRLSPAELVNVSRPVDSPLHGEFEWDDSIAAEKWREQTGRVMIASISVTVDDVNQTSPVRAYFNIEHASHEYIPTEVIMSDEAKKERLLNIAKKELESFKAKYQTLTELADVIRAIDEVIGEHKQP
mgnify:CR=1 FL=1